MVNQKYFKTKVADMVMKQAPLYGHKGIRVVSGCFRHERVKFDSAANHAGISTGSSTCRGAV